MSQQVREAPIFETELQRLEKLEKHQSKLKKCYNSKDQTLKLEHMSFLVAVRHSALLQMLPTLKIQTLSLSRCKISSKKLKDFLKSLSNLQTFALDEADSMKPLCNKSFFSALPQTLDSLQLNRMLFQQNEQVSLKPALKQVDISQCLDFHTFSELPPAMHSLRLAENQMGVQHAMLLSQLLIDNNSLLFLDLQGNQLGSAGTKLLCEALREHTKIQSLNLDTNGICSDGAFAIVKLLQKGHSLQELHLRHNLISQVGLQQILQACSKEGCGLKYLDLALNFVTIDILHVLRQVFERNQSLQYLFLSDLHKWHTQALHAFGDSLNAHKKLKLLSLPSCTKHCQQLLERCAPGKQIKVYQYIKSHTQPLQETYTYDVNYQAHPQQTEPSDEPQILVTKPSQKKALTQTNSLERLNLAMESDPGFDLQHTITEAPSTSAVKVSSILAKEITTELVDSDSSSDYETQGERTYRTNSSYKDIFGKHLQVAAGEQSTKRRPVQFVRKGPEQSGAGCYGYGQGKSRQDGLRGGALAKDQNYRSQVSLRSQETGSSFVMTQYERDMMKAKMSNDKVVGFYKRVLGDIREAISSERKQIQRYM